MITACRKTEADNISRLSQVGVSFLPPGNNYVSSLPIWTTHLYAWVIVIWLQHLIKWERRESSRVQSSSQTACAKGYIPFSTVSHASFPSHVELILQFRHSYWRAIYYSSYVKESWALTYYILRSLMVVTYSISRYVLQDVDVLF